MKTTKRIGSSYSCIEWYEKWVKDNSDKMIISTIFTKYSIYDYVFIITYKE